jgi:carboxymethylenebutenolidase
LCFLLIRAKLNFNKSANHEKLTKKDISQEVFDLYDDYAHNKIDRRRFVEKLSLFAVGALTVPSLLSFMTPNYVDSIN